MVVEIRREAATTVKLVEDVAVFAPTVTEIAPVVAVSVVAVEEDTVAATPFNLTALLAEVALKPCPWIVTVASGPPCDGEKLRIERPFEMVEWTIPVILPAES